MTLPSDNQQANDDTKVDGPTHPEYEMLGHFQPRDAKRILKRLEEQHLSFEVNDCRQIRLFTVWPFYRSYLCIYVRREHKEKAEAISDEDSVRSRAAAGIRYVTVGGIICAVALLHIRSGVRSIPYYRDGSPIPLEFVAGIAGIVVFMGFLQLGIAIHPQAARATVIKSCASKPSNQSMKPKIPFRNTFSVFATTPCRGLSLSR